MKKVVLDKESLDKLRDDFTVKAFITSKRLEKLNKAMDIITAIEQEGALIVGNGRYTVYGLCYNKLKYLGFCKFYFQAIKLVGEDSGIIVSKPHDGEVEYRLIVNGDLNHIWIYGQ